jgi:hypothetical protein
VFVREVPAWNFQRLNSVICVEQMCRLGPVIGVCMAYMCRGEPRSCESAVVEVFPLANAAKVVWHGTRTRWLVGKSLGSFWVGGGILYGSLVESVMGRKGLGMGGLAF